MPWTQPTATTQILAVHAALTHTGHILLVGGDQHDEDLNEANDVFHTRLFDCTNLTVTTVPSPPFDAFCAGHAHLIDGRVLFAGGTDDFPTHLPGEPHPSHFPGLRDSAIWNPRTRTWTPAAPMRPEPGRTTGGGRWYPTLLTLAQGTVLAISGHPRIDDTRHGNDTPEVFSPSPRTAGAWRLLGSPDPANTPEYYPRGHVLPLDAQVFFVTPVGSRTRKLRPEPYGWTDLGPPIPETSVYGGFACSSVLLPLLPENGYRARILAVGGTDSYLFDTGNPAAGWQPAGRGIPSRPIRRHAHATLLANGMVAVTGGVTNPGDDATAVRTVELYDPATGAWSTGEAATITRNYHSVALLMPDGRVFTAGGNARAQQSFPPGGGDTRELRIELYAPPYHAMPRPTIGWAPDAVGWGEAFHVQVTEPDRVRRVAMIRAGSATHAWDGDQRFVGCEFRHEGGWLLVRAPRDTAVAPTGTYQLVAINDAGVPSAGRFVRLAPPRRGSSALVQSNHNFRGNFELVSPRPGGGLNHHSRNNEMVSSGWSGPTAVAPDSGVVSSVPTMLQSNIGRRLEVVARLGDRLAYYFREGSWQGPVLFGAQGATGNPAMIQSWFGGHGNFELVVPDARGGFAHYWRHNDVPSRPWYGGDTPIGGTSGPIDAIALVQSNYGDPGDLEVVARYGTRLALWRRESGPPMRWTGPHFFFDGAAGVPSMVQSRFGTRGNFELVTPLAAGGAGHLARMNDAPGQPWSGVTPFADGERILAVSLVESNFGTPGHGGNLEVMLRTADGRNVHYWRADNAPAWNYGGTLP